MSEGKLQWPGWEVVEQIGSGSFGAVYHIRRELFGDWEHAALKVLSLPRNAQHLQQLYDDCGDRDSVARLLNGQLEDIYKEYAMMTSLKGNTNIVCCDDFRHQPRADGIGWHIFIKMELLTPLTQYLESGYNEKTVIRMGMDICSALSLCQSRNIIHRDIKPQNIFVSRDGNFKLGDFGIAKIADRIANGTQIGTFRYMAPEVYNHRPYGPQADIYSLGLVMYWMLNKRRVPFLPLEGTIDQDMLTQADHRRFRGEPLPAPLYGHPELKKIILKACSPDPAHRYADPERMRRDLDAVSKCSVTIAAQPEPRAPGSGPHWRPPGDLS